MSPENSRSAFAQGAWERHFRTLRPGMIPYADGLNLQKKLLSGRRQEVFDILLLLEHLPVITMGKAASNENLHLTDSEDRRLGIEKIRTWRGGDATYHGPGQLVGYPIVDLEPLGRDLHRYLRLLEATLIDSLTAFGLSGERIAGKTGVWVDGEKIESIGIGVRGWVSWHGFALNVAADLSGFATIIPCGLPGVHMTSLERLLGHPVPLSLVEAEIIRSLPKFLSAVTKENMSSKTQRKPDRLKVSFPDGRTHGAYGFASPILA